MLDRKAEAERDLRRGTYVAREQREVTFGDYYARWVRARRISSARQHTDESRAANHVLPYREHWALCDIRPSDIDDWIGELARKMGPDSVRHCHTLLRGPIRRAVKDRIIDDPCIDIELPAKREIRKDFDDVLTREEVERLVAAVPDPDTSCASLRTTRRYQAMILMGCWLGPRFNEAPGVRVCDLNPLHGEMVFGRVVVNQNGSRTFTERLSKTEDARTVPVPSPVMDALQARIEVFRPGAPPGIGHHAADDCLGLVGNWPA